MPRYEITSPDGKRFEVTAPAGATQEQVLAYAQSQFKPVEPYKPVSPTDDMSTGQRMLAGVGKGMVDLGRGAGQMLGMVSPQDVAEARKYDAPLANTGAGATGQFLGTMATAIPAMMIPGANSVTGAALTGGAMGAFQPTVEGESRLQNAAIGAAAGGVGQKAIGVAANALGNRLAAKEASEAVRASQNSVRDATLKSAQGAGYVVPPSQAGSGVVGRVLEGISGKYKTNQAAGIKNQSVTDALARKALGLAEDQPITREAMQGVRDKAFAAGYEPLTKAGALETDRAYAAALDKIVSDYKGASRSFPEAVKNAVGEKIDTLRVPAMDAGDALKMTRILRDEANAAYASGDAAMGKATKQAANAIEDQVERALEAAGKDGAEMLKSFRDARTLMAKAHSVEKAIVESGGHVNAKVLGAALQRGKPLTGELKTIGAFANNFKDVAGVPQSGWANPITALDAFGTAGLAGMGAGPMSVALPGARIAARSAILSPAYQRTAHPTYGPGLMEKLSPELLKELEKRGVGWLLGYASQQ